MKLIRNLFSGGVLVLLCCAASMAQSVQTDYDRFTVRATGTHARQAPTKAR